MSAAPGAPGADTAPLHVAILGATGYGAGELLRLLTQHPTARVVTLTSSSMGGAAVADAHPHLAGFYDHVTIADALDWDRLLDAPQAVIFAALPHGLSARAADELLTAAADRPSGGRLRFIDLSGDLRLKDAELHERYYPGTPLLPERRAAFTYGLPELGRDAVRAARCIANPGCLATAAILALAPLAERALAGPVVIDAKTGSSGSGRQLKDTTHHPTRHADFRAYRPLGHQHEPEIAQALGDPRQHRLALSFVPQSLPVSRGIFTTAHATLADGVAGPALAERYRAFYADAPFVRVRDVSPTLQDVVGSNFCDVAVAARGRQVIAMAALDNLVKGMAGTAIQNMNLMCGLDERSGLWSPGLRPV